jgi:hypothetical protein
MPFNDGFFTNSIDILPPQMIPISQKNDEWKKKCMDSLEQIGRRQYQMNMGLLENYSMVKGTLILSHYFGESGYQDMISQLTAEFEMPNYLRHYDMISPVVNVMSAEFQKLPDVFRVKGMDEDTTNQYTRKQDSMISDYIESTITNEINQKLLQQGIDPNKKNFKSKEEQDQYEEMIQRTKSAMTPPQIGDYMKTKFMTAAEIWGQNQLEKDKQRYRLDEKEKVEFEDMLIADRCFRHFYLTPSGYNQETWNPINTFFHKSPDYTDVEEGDYVGRIFYLTIADIVDRYGYRMTKSQLDALESGNIVRDERWNYSKGSDYVYKNYMFPFQGYPAYDALRQTNSFFNIESQGIPYMDEGALGGIYGNSLFNEKRGYYFVTEAYWKSQQKIGIVTYIDPQTGLFTRKLVDENFVVPPGFTEVDSTYDDRQDINTVVWTWVNWIWTGKKINVSTYNKDSEDIYFDIHPLEFQFKGDINPYCAKLPVCGSIFSIRNSQSMSLVDMMKPYQIMFNVSLNQAYQMAEKEIGSFIVFDVNLMPKDKDWGGANSFDKWLMTAKAFGLVPIDTSPENTKGSLAAQNASFPKILNLDLGAQMVSRFNMAMQAKTLGYSLVGFNEYRTGEFAATATAGGVDQGTKASYATTQSYFTNFSNYLRRCYRMNLDIAQYVQSQNKDITISYTQSDLSNAFIKVKGTDLLLADLHVYVSNSQEYLRQLEMLRQLAMENNTSGATLVDLAHIITSNSIAEIKKQLQGSVDFQQQQLAQKQQNEQQQMQIQQQIAQLKEQQENDRLDKTLANKIEVAEIMATKGGVIPEDKEGNMQKLDLQQQQINNQASSDNKKHELDVQKQIDQKQLAYDQLSLQNKKIDASLSMQAQKLQEAKIMKGIKQKEAKKK